MKSLGMRFLLPFAALAILFSAFLIYQTYLVNQQHARALMDQQAALALEFNLAIRDYAGKKIRPVMEAMLEKDDFIPETMSTSFISRNIFEAVRKTFPDYVIRFASDNPRNPINMANPDEQRMLDFFRANSTVSGRVEELEISGQPYLAHFTPRWFQVECMHCHGDPKAAPAALIRQYGATASFHRKPGDLAGLDMVAIPTARMRAALRSEMRWQSLLLAAGLAILVGSVIGTFRVVVTGRLAAMADHFRTIAAQPEPARMVPMAVSGSDEISVLGASFNVLVEELRGVHASLERRVDQRTSELSQANLALTREIAERQQAENALADRTRQLESVGAITAEITRELDLRTLLRLIMHRACELTGANGGDLFLWNEATEELELEAAHGEARDREKAQRRLGEGVTGTVAQRREGLLLNEYRTCVFAHPHTLAHRSIVAVLVEPLLYGDRLLGVLGVNHGEEGSVFTPRDQATLRLFAAQAAIAIENARLFHEQQEAYASLQRAQDELVRAAKLRALGQMAAGIAHDLNNMLAVILGQVELLKLRRTTAEVGEVLDSVQTAAMDGASVVRRLQDFARQRATSPLAPMDLAQAVRETLEITRPRWKDEAQRRGRRIEVRTTLEGLPEVLGHAPEIREVLTNLIFNAVDAMPDGGSLTFAGESTEDGVVLRVSDTGLGMPEEVRQRLFEPFFTTKGVRGTGLGLSVAYGIMERHGGSIQIESGSGRGTTIVLRFQAAPARDAAVPERPALRPAPRRLLLIDDDEMVRTTLARLLRESGHTVLEAESGPRGLALLQEASVDFVLTDLGMPDMSGIEVARRIKSQYSQLPVLLLTGWGAHWAGDAAELAAADRVIDKPVKLEDLLRSMAALDPSTPRDAP